MKFRSKANNWSEIQTQASLMATEFILSQVITKFKKRVLGIKHGKTLSYHQSKRTKKINQILTQTRLTKAIKKYLANTFNKSLINVQQNLPRKKAMESFLISINNTSHLEISKLYPNNCLKPIRRVISQANLNFQETIQSGYNVLLKLILESLCILNYRAKITANTCFN